MSAERVEWLLGELCTGLGFCLPPDERQRLRDAPPRDATQFAMAVFRAEGLDPAGDRRLFAQVEGVVARTFGRAPGGDV